MRRPVALAALMPWLPLALLGAVALLPLGVTDPYWLGILILSMYFALISSGWNLLAGYTGSSRSRPRRSRCSARTPRGFCVGTPALRRGSG